MKKILSGLLLAMSVSLFAQQEPGNQAPESEVKTDYTIDDEKSVQNMIDDCLQAKGWTEGENNKKSGQKFFVACGVGVIQAPTNSKHYINSRVAAYSKAMLDAKRQMVEFLETSIQTETQKDYSEGNFGKTAQAPKKASQEETEIRHKVKALFYAKLDAELKASGVPADKLMPEQVKKILNSESFKKLIKTAARASIVGMQIYNSFEYTPRNKKGEIGVIAIWSPKLRTMASSISSPKTMPSGIMTKAIKMQIPNNPKILLSTFGVQMKLDQNGNLTLISFGQAGALTSSRMSAIAAGRKAKMNAMAAIREFAGENVAVETQMLNAETAQELEETGAVYENESAFKEKIKAVSDAMKIRGISVIRRWKMKHPINKNYVYGVVCSWSPQSSKNASTLRETMKRKGPASTQKSVNKMSKKNARGKSVSHKKFKNSGQGADDNAF